MGDFVHLHVHTEYSLLDGACSIKKLIARTKELGMKSVAITDHGSMFGIIDFYKEAVKAGIKPIIGCEVYTSPRRYTDKEPGKDDFQYHLVLLAKNNAGYKNLTKIVSRGYTEGFYYKPRVDKDILRQFNGDVIGLSACIGGEIQQHILNNNYDKAREAALEYDGIFGRGNFYLEMQNHGIPEEIQVNSQLIRLSQETGIPLVATNDVHYIKKGDAKTHDVLLCIQTAKTLEDQDRMKFPNDEFYLRSYDEMKELFKSTPEALSNTALIAEQCDVNFDFNQIHLPAFEIKDNKPSHEYLRELCMYGLKRRYQDYQDNMERLEYELKTIKDMGYCEYFLIVWDFIRFAKDNDIMVGPGRGSAAGSLVAYCLGITDIDPIKYNLIFERFLNPERISMPDIDIDFCFERREEVIQYVIEKYGKERVAQIITFGTMAARAAIRDVGRAINMSYQEVDYIAKQIPMQIGMTIDKALEVNKELAKMYEDNSNVKVIIDTAREVEGMPRHASTHAAGVVISKVDIDEYVPLYRQDTNITTQFPMGTLEELGLLKMDFLGLRTLTVIRDAKALIKQVEGLDVDMSSLDYSDPEVYKMLSEGDTDGVFQLESSGMKQFLRELKPSSFEDIIAGISLYRPGPMESIPTYVKNKNNPGGVTYGHPLLKDILDVTYGCIVYQEQVMQIVRKLAGYSYGRSDLVRRAMSKKKMDVMEQERKNFIFGIVDKDGTLSVPGALRNGVPEKVANHIFDQMIDFAKYAFNKSHAAAYAVLAYQTAYLKRHYPVEFMAALITSVMGSSGKVAQYVANCKKMGIAILPPDVNYSYDQFTVIDGKIRFGLAAVKNVGRNTIKDIIRARKAGEPFKSLVDFCTRVNSRELNKRAVESLIRAGAFDSLGCHRSQLMAIYEKVLEGVQNDKRNNVEGQISLFGVDSSTSAPIGSLQDNLPKIAEFNQRAMLAMEKEVLGIYVSGHPLDEYSQQLSDIADITTAEIMALAEEGQNHELSSTITDGTMVTLGGLVASRKNKTTRNNNLMAFVTLEDLYGTVEVIVFPTVLEKYNKYLYNDGIIILRGRISLREEEEPKIICEEVKILSNENISNEPPKESKDIKKIYIKIDHNQNKGLIDEVKGILSKYKGQTPVYLFMDNEKKVYMTDRELWIDVRSELVEELRRVVGHQGVKLD